MTRIHTAPAALVNVDEWTHLLTRRVRDKSHHIPRDYSIPIIKAEISNSAISCYFLDYTPPTSFNRSIAPTQSSFTVSGGDDDDSSLDDLITFYTQQRDSAENPADYYIEEDDMDFEEFITFSTLMEEQKPAVEKLPQLQICKTESDESVETLQAKSTTPALLPVTTPVTVSDVPLIMSQLPLDMRIRFLEKFAESAALHFCAISTLPADGTAHPCLCLGEASSHETQNPVALQKLVHDKINEMDLASRNWSRV
jgi:hypothetical protein